MSLEPRCALLYEQARPLLGTLRLQAFPLTRKEDAMFDITAEHASHHFIQALIDSDRHHVGTLENGVFVEATAVPNSPASAPASHGLVFFERYRVAVPSSLVNTEGREPVFNSRRRAPRGIDLSETRLTKVGGSSSYWLCDLKGLGGIDDPNRCIVWELVEWSRRQDGEPIQPIQPIRCIPLAGFEDCVGGGTPRPANQPTSTADPGSGSACTVLVLDTGLRPHPAFPDHPDLGQLVDTVSPGTASHPNDEDEIYDPTTGGLRWFAGHGTFVAGLIHRLAPSARILVADVTDAALVPFGGPYIVNEVQLRDSLVAGLHRAKEFAKEEARPYVVVNLSIAAKLLDGDGEGLFATAVQDALDEWEGNILFLAAGGNIPGGEVVDCDGDKPATFPAGLKGVMAVAATDSKVYDKQTGQPVTKPTSATAQQVFTKAAWWSVNAGAIDAWAPGEELVGPHPGGFAPYTLDPALVSGGPVPASPLFLRLAPDCWVSWSGTSVAVAYAAGTVAAATVAGVNAHSPVDVWGTLPLGTPEGATVPVGMPKPRMIL